MNFSLKTKITTSHYQETIEFYRQVLGMAVLEEWDHANDKGAILGLKNGKGEAMLEIYLGQESYDFSGLSLQFKVQNLNDFIGQLPTTVERTGPKSRPWGSTYLYLRDPNYILLIVYQGGL